MLPSLERGTVDLRCEAEKFEEERGKMNGDVLLNKRGKFKVWLRSSLAFVMALQLAVGGWAGAVQAADGTAADSGYVFAGQHAAAGMDSVI